jgi:hypothetical protein
VSISTCTNIGQVNKQIDVEIYPNPSDGIIFIKCLNEKLNHFDVVNSIGQTTYTRSTIKELEQYEFTKNGIYFLRFYGGNKVIVKKVIIIK